MKNKITVFLLSFILLVLSVFAWIKPETAYSEAERRYLEKFPKLSFSTLIAKDGFMNDFESYAVDQFPLRETFRKINAYFNKYILNQKTVNDIYIYNGYAAKLEYRESEKDLDYSIARIKSLYEMYLENSNVYLSVIPDKNYYLSKESGYLSLDYEKFIGKIKENTGFATYIDITDTLSIENYYKTDTHWKQETLKETAEKILSSMGNETGEAYTVNTFSEEFFGVYTGQVSLTLTADKLCYLTNETLDSLKVYTHDSGKREEMELYDFEKANGKDPYELYLSGSLSLIEIENENAENDKELVIFRDSFGSSISPLLASSYKKVTIIDTRYITPMALGNFVNFENADVLFLYSTLVLNSSIGQLLP